ncbi:uncharacterized protein LOC142318918 [Lycorma delicatula]|uniref:uncharacterized protein LOC142318918 n=1 Tax=Lycorma delicatula TaxID=130591 RepID=UPI003F50E9FD
MRVLVVLFAAVACVVAKPAAVSYAYSAVAPLVGYPYAAAYSPFAYAAAPAAVPAVYSAPAVVAAGVPAPALAYAAHAPVAPIAPFVAAGVKSQYHSQDELGQASYGHAEPGQTHNAIQDAFGNKVGSFSFVNPHGKLIQTNYVADAAGYRVASNDLPVAPVDTAVPPAPVADTPEVAAAKAAHFAELESAKSRSKRAAVITPAATSPIVAAPVVHPYVAHPYHAAYPYAVPYAAPYPHAYPTTNVQPVVTPDGFIADTPEVVAAKANHFAQVAVAKARTAYPYLI